MTYNVLRLLEQEGYIKEGEDNLIHAEKAFFAARVMGWIKNKAATEKDFDLSPYLKMLTYYKLDLADLKFSEDEDTILYQMKKNDKEVQELVDSLIESARKPVSKIEEPDPDT